LVDVQNDLRGNHKSPRWPKKRGAARGPAATFTKEVELTPCFRELSYPVEENATLFSGCVFLPFRARPYNGSATTKTAKAEG